MSRARPVAALVIGAALVAAACTEEPPSTGGPAMPADTGSADATSVVEQFAGQPWFAGTVPTEPVEATGDPIVIGHINQEDVPFGSFPEVRLAVEAGVELINTELGGVDGRPLQLVTCIANFSIEGSQSCAQQFVQAGAVAVVGGLDVMSIGSIPVLEQNGIPYVGGIPVNYDEMRSPISFQFSGGSPGAMVAFSHDVIDRGHDGVAVVYADFGPIESAALDYSVALLEAAGVATITQVPYPIGATDMLPYLTQAGEDEPDAILMFAADAACLLTMQTVADLGIDADVYMVGSCAAPAILSEAGEDAYGYIFNVETPVGIPTERVDFALYQEALEWYGADDLEAASAGTVSFRAVMNLWSAMVAIGADDVTPASLVAWFSDTVDQPSYDGHPYTCDGRQIPELPALCAAQQVLIRVDEHGDLAAHSDGWIDVPTILAEG